MSRSKYLRLHKFILLFSKRIHKTSSYSIAQLFKYQLRLFMVYKDWNMLGWEWTHPFLLPCWPLAPVMSKATMSASASHTCQFRIASMLMYMGGGWNSIVTSESEDIDLFHGLWSEGSWGGKKSWILCELLNFVP